MRALLHRARAHPLWTLLLLLGVALLGARTASRVLEARSASAEARAAAVLRCPQDMRAIPAGSFSLGDEVPVELDAFCLDASEVTLEAYSVCVRAGGCDAPAVTAPACNWGHAERGQHPVNCVAWREAERYCRFVDKALPSEAQWEYAARGGFRQTAYPWGDAQPDRTQACWSPLGNQRSTCEVGSFPPTTFGLHDMAGNVSEWTVDSFAPYPARAPRNFVQHQATNLRVSRGGSFSVGDPMLLQGIVRQQRAPEARLENIGLRCARAVLP